MKEKCVPEGQAKKKVKETLDTLESAMINTVGKPGHYGVKPVVTKTYRPYDQPMKNRLGRGDQPPNIYPPRSVEDEEDEMDVLEQMIDLYIDKLKMTEATDEEYSLDDKEENELDNMPKDEPAEQFDAVRKDIGESFDIAHMIIDMKLNENYKEYFRSMMKKHGIKDLGDLSPEKKKEFFRAVDKGWKAEKEKAA